MLHTAKLRLKSLFKGVRHTLTTPASGKLKQGDHHEFRASLGYSENEAILGYRISKQTNNRPHKGLLCSSYVYV